MVGDLFGQEEELVPADDLRACKHSLLASLYSLGVQSSCVVVSHSKPIDTGDNGQRRQLIGVKCKRSASEGRKEVRKVCEVERPETERKVGR